MTTSTQTDSYIMNFLGKIGDGKRTLSLLKGEAFFSQGDCSDAVFFIRDGHVKISVVSNGGKEGVVAMLGPNDFFGEGCLVGQSLRMNSATALEPSTVVRIEKAAMTRALRNQPALCEKFVSALLKRVIGLEEDLCAQLLNDSEKRLARVLLKLNRLRDNEVTRDATFPILSHETMAEMVGTTRSRVTHLMNKFRRQGLIEYNNHGITMRSEKFTEN